MTTAVLSTPSAGAGTAARAPGTFAAPETARRTIDWTAVAQAFLLMAATCACYWPALRGAFLWDDDILIVTNPLVQSPGGLARIWFSTAPYDYFPLTYTSFWVEWSLWGANPVGYHLVNLALHVAGAFLFWRLLEALRLPGAWFGAVLFAIHPINVASVAWIAERKNVLSMVFYLASLIAFVRAEDALDPRRWRKMYLLALGWFVLAALSKSSVVMLPCVLLLLAWWRRGKIGWRDLARSIPFFAVSLASGLLTVWFQYHRTMAPERLLEANPLPLRALIAGRSILFYLGKIVWPTRLSMLYPRWEMSTASPGDFLPLIGVAALLGAAWYGRRFWGRGPFTALAYFVVTLLPVSGLMHMSFFTYAYVSDHLVHVSTLGIFALAAATLGTLYARGGTAATAALVTMSAIVTVLCISCFARADEFSSPERLWRAALEITPDAPAAHNNLGEVMMNGGNLMVAEAHFRKALQLDPKMNAAGTNLANVLRMEGRWPQSAAAYEAVLKRESDPHTLNNYGVVLLEEGNVPAAREQLGAALRLDPGLIQAHFNLYRAALAVHDPAAAAGELRACLRIDPDDEESLVALAALSVDSPASEPPAGANGAAPSVGSPASEAVVALAERACQVSKYRDAVAMSVLSRAYLAAGRGAEALAVGERALAVARDSGQADLAAKLEPYLAGLRR